MRFLKKIWIPDKNFDFWQIFWFLRENWIFDKNFFLTKDLRIWSKVSTKISIFDQNFYFWPQFLFLTKISMFDQNFYVWPKFLCLTKISMFDQNFYFWPKFLCLTKFFIFDQNFYFLSTFLFLTKKFSFWTIFRPKTTNYLKLCHKVAGVAAGVKIATLSGSEEAFAIDRKISRLAEMSSETYWNEVQGVFEEKEKRKNK